MSSDRSTSITSSQIRKHTLQLDDHSPDCFVWQASVIDKDLTTPPISPSEGDRYLIISGGSGTDWSGHDNKIAQYINSSWSFYTPLEGWFIWINDENKLYKFDGSSWIDYKAVDGSTIIISSGILEVKDSGITGSKLAAGIGGYGLEKTATNLWVELNGLSAAVVDVSADSIAIIDADEAGHKTRKESIADLATAMAGTGITATNGVLAADASTGDMLKSIYDTGDNGIVDKAETLTDGGSGNEVTYAQAQDAVDKVHTVNTDTALGAQSEDLDMNTHKVTGVVDPVADQDAATKKYVDDNAVATSDVTRNTLNIIQNAFNIAVEGSYSKYNMVDSAIDVFIDETGIDTVNSLNEDYDSVNDLYKPTSVAEIEIDYMEYATDSAAQVAYVSSDSGSIELLDSYSEANMDNNHNMYNTTVEVIGQCFYLPAATITSVKFFLAKDGTPPGGVSYVKLWAVTGTLGVDAKPTGSVLATSNSLDPDTFPEGSAAHILKEFTFSTPYEWAGGNIAVMFYYQHADSNAANGVNIGDDVGTFTHPGNMAYSTDQGSNWLYYNGDMCFYLYGKIVNLQSYSEDTIKEQGSYSLKTIAVITDSLNDTLTRTVSPTIDLSDVDTLVFDARASRTGTNFEIQIHDVGGTTTTKTVNIASADTFQEVSWDISAVTNANKDAIDSIIIKITNANVANTIYIDNFKTVAVINNMTLIGNSSTAETEPDSVRIIINEEDVDSITLNTDLKAYATIDGSTWAQATLASEGSYGSEDILTGMADVSGQTGTSVKYKITTLNNKSLKLHKIATIWN